MLFDEMCHVYLKRLLIESMLKWKKNGTQLEDFHYENGVKKGLWTWWHENGNLSKRGRFVGGREQGTWKAWHPNGVLGGRTVYQGGQAIANDKWCSHGEQLSQMTLSSWCAALWRLTLPTRRKLPSV